MQNLKDCGKINANQGRLTCPDCGFLLARFEKGATVSGLLLYCRKCKKQIVVNIPKTEP